MVTKENSIVNQISKINLLAFYVCGSVSLFDFLVDEYQKSMFLLIIGLMNLYQYFDWMEKEND